MLPLLGYLNSFSVAPGETVEVKVGSFGAKSYRAELRRIIQGDRNPEGPGYREEPVALDLGGERPARRQDLKPGSYVLIPDRGGVLSELRSFTIAAPVWPTRYGSGERIILRLTGAEVELGLDEAGRPMLRIGGERIALLRRLELKRWSLLVASLDAKTDRLRLSHLGEHRRVEEEADTALRSDPVLGGPATALIAARAAGAAHFDGKIDSPAIFGCVMEADEVLSLLLDPERLARHPRLVAYWDFARGIDGARIHDASPHRLDGRTHQCPARAMVGWRWQGQTLDWRQRPDLYSAIHFHSDDITDAGWDTDFAFQLPEGLRGGVYSVRLVPDGDESQAYHCVFALRPPREHASGNAVCLLLPTASYLAYANHRLGIDVPGTEVGMGRLVEIDRHHAFLQEHPEVGFSFYEVHDDGSGVFYSSRNRPVVDLQPGIKGFLGGYGSNLWQFNADTHITGWLEHEGVPYDVVTDEDLHREGLSLLRRYRVVLTGTHPEYTSLEMLNALQGFLDRGGRLMYLGGNGFYWCISFSNLHPGVIECRRSEVGIRPWDPGHGQYHHAFTGEHGGLWRRNGRPSGALTGLIMSSQGFDVSEPYVLGAAAGDPRVAFLFEGIDNRLGRRFGAFGLSGGGAAGLEVDRADHSLGTPAHALVVASSERHTDIYLWTPEELLDPTPDICGTQSELIRADMVFFETAGGGAVFSTGSIAWAGAMAWNGYENEVSRLTANVLKRFVDPTPFEPPAAQAHRL
ncbi:MAG TPA: N,N-dimethylformamidase beta subunit family domain-containing protein [Alphaproteobacteria bacterium]|nr:N,N-dimethylformamidase beta subunit family domain-containing protein [Alphaproteobacteria bacterium]